MTHLFINYLAASAGGGLTYVRNVTPLFSATPGFRFTVALSPDLRREFGHLPNVDFVELGLPPARRFWYEQRTLPELIRKSGANVLLSAGNFALRKSPVPQILLSRNSLYVSGDFSRDLLERREFRMWLDLRARAFLAKRSIEWADVTVAPSHAFASELQRWTGENVIVIHHGFDRDAFVRDTTPLAPEVQLKLDAVEGAFKILFVSHYNYYRNFETLIRALPIVRDRLSGTPVRLLLTCELAAGKNPGQYRPDRAANLVRELGVSDMVVELGSVPYKKLHQLYGRADVYATPAYTETFAHPLVEAMASGVPVVASDIPVHREICGAAALYFERFSPEALANCIVRVAEDKVMRATMVDGGTSRAGDFSWRVHVNQILELARNLTSND